MYVHVACMYVHGDVHAAPGECALYRCMGAIHATHTVPLTNAAMYEAVNAAMYKVTKQPKETPCTPDVCA